MASGMGISMAEYCYWKKGKDGWMAADQAGSSIVLWSFSSIEPAIEWLSERVEKDGRVTRLGEAPLISDSSSIKQDRKNLYPKYVRSRLRRNPGRTMRRKRKVAWLAARGGAEFLALFPPSIVVIMDTIEFQILPPNGRFLLPRFPSFSLLFFLYLDWTGQEQGT